MITKDGWVRINFQKLVDVLGGEFDSFSGVDLLRWGDYRESYWECCHMYKANTVLYIAFDAFDDKGTRINTGLATLTPDRRVTAVECSVDRGPRVTSDYDDYLSVNKFNALYMLYNKTKAEHKE